MQTPLEIARELEERSGLLQDAIAQIRELELEAEMVGRRAAELKDFLGRRPAEQAALKEREAQAVLEVEQARVADGAATHAVNAAERRGKAGQLSEAQRTAERAREDLHAAEAKAARLRKALSDLERRAEAAEGEASEVQDRARAVAASLEQRGADEATPGDGLGGVVDWAGRARASLFAARSGLERERDSVLRETSELAAIALGEPMLAGGAGELRRRLEQLP